MITTSREIACTVSADLELACLTTLHVELISYVADVAFGGCDSYGTEIACGTGGGRG